MESSLSSLSRASTVVTVISSSRRNCRGGILAHPRWVNAWSGYGLPSRTPLKIIATFLSWAAFAGAAEIVGASPVEYVHPYFVAVFRRMNHPL